MKKLICTMLIAITAMGLQAQQKKAGIGLALSGGGAKGLAHIGILKAIDSAELNIDYLTGTSMGSIVGGLYAAGYSADSIEMIARTINWDMVLSNTMPMNYFTMEEKSEFGKYALELPLKDFKLKIPAGFLESQELWLTLEKYFYPVAAIKDFDQFSIPFRCISNNLMNGDVEVLGKGNIVPAVRSSMALPGIFSPIDIDGKRMIDGGVLRNLPVKEVREMGASYAIGVSVSSPVSTLDELDNAFAVTTQAIFINDQKSYAEQSALCNKLINIPMGSFTSGSFDQSDGIIDLGIDIGRKFYPYFKHLADSLKAANPQYTFRRNRLPDVQSYKLSSVKVNGLKKFEENAFFEQIGFDSSNTINSDQLQKNTRRAFAYRMYKSVTYHIQPAENGTFELEYDVKPESRTKMKLGINENSFTGFGVLLNVTTRNTFTPFSRSMISLNVGENFRGMLEHLQMFGYRNPWSNRFRVYYESQKVPTFTDFRKTGEYALKYLQIDDRFQLSAKKKSAGGIGMQWEYLDAEPKVETGLYFNGSTNYFNLYGFWQYNNLEQPFFAPRGTVIDLMAGYVTGIAPNFTVYRDGVLLGDITKDLLDYGNYARVTASVHNTMRLSKRLSWINQLQGGANLSDKVSLLNNFFGGGVSPTFRNQVQMVGLLEGETDSESMISVQTGPRYNPFGGLYVSLNGGLMTYDFVQKSSLPNMTQQWLASIGLTLAYDTPIGPVSFTMMSSSKTEGLRTYFNLGFPFK